MRVIDPGHFYELDHLDGEGKSLLRFVKRIGDKYPGNDPPGYEGVIIQEVLRALLNRMLYVNNQEYDAHNSQTIELLRSALEHLEERAAQRRGGDFYWWLQALNDYRHNIENAPICKTCGHVACTAHGEKK